MAWNVLGVCTMSSWLESLSHCYHMVDLVLDLESWYTNLVSGSQWILEEIWGSIQFYVLLFAYNLLVAVCTLLISLSWSFSCQCRGTNKNVTTMWGLVLEETLSVIIWNHTVESDIVSSKIYPIECIHLGLNFTSDKEDFLVEMCIFLSLAIFGPCWRG